MDTLITIKTRKAIREWEHTDIPEDVLNKVLDAGRFSPSPLNAQPWHFIVLKNKQIIQDLMKTAKHGTFATDAPIVIVATAIDGKNADTWLYEQEPNIYNFSTVCAMTNMWLASWDLKLGGCWVTLDKEVARKLLVIPDTHSIVGSIALGYPRHVETTALPKDRKPLEEVVSYDSF